MRRSAALVAIAAALMAPAMPSGAQVIRLDRDRAPPLDYSGGERSAPSPNGGKRRTVAQDRRAAQKRRNRLRARGHHRQAVR